ncbi:MAG: DHA2 family efflux MFS transporter permease subunit [Methylovirgula sp.]|nr:DHA2 family efflux MFS transporter permease subunit [Methylovirgula sp.]
MTLAIDDGRRSVATWGGFAMMCIGMFMALLDTQVVVTSLPTIQRALGIPQNQMSWIQTAYLISEIISIPLTGLLTRVLGIRRLFIVSVSFFTLASIGCANSSGFSSLILWRICQGFSGGTLIPAVFAAVFLLFPVNRQTLATMIASVLAVLAPTVGPLVGGWVTQTYNWPWLFLINVIPGVLVAIAGIYLLPRESLRLEQLRNLDVISLLFGAGALAALEIAIKEAPDRGWSSPWVIGLFVFCAIAASIFIWRTLRTASPLVEIRTFADRNFTVGCALSLVVGMGLYGSIYLMPVFLAYVRGHNALQIGEIMLVTGIAQIACAPIVATLVRRFDIRILSAVGFLALALGAALSSGQTQNTDFAGMFAGQLVRGCAFMFCVLPPTELALGNLSPAVIPDASGLFNLMRNLGGALGIAIIDSIIFTRSPDYAQKLFNGLLSGDSGTLSTLGMTRDAVMQAAADPAKRAVMVALLKKVAFADAINDAWFALAIVTLSIPVLLILARPVNAIMRER